MTVPVRHSELSQARVHLREGRTPRNDRHRLVLDDAFLEVAALREDGIWARLHKLSRAHFDVRWLVAVDVAMDLPRTFTSDEHPVVTRGTLVQIENFGALRSYPRTAA